MPAGARLHEAASVEKFQGLALRVGKGIPAPHTALHSFRSGCSIVTFTTRAIDFAHVQGGFLA
jgi:hypothetical protein